MDRIIERFHNLIRFPTTAAEMNEAKILWQRHFCLLTVVGDLDCTQVTIKIPNYMRMSISTERDMPQLMYRVLVTPLEDLQVSVQNDQEVSVHDARIWCRSPVQGIMSHSDGGARLLGDSGYRLSPWFVTPFKAPANEAERNFNLCHSRERIIIE